MKTIWGLAVTIALAGCGSSESSGGEQPTDSGSAAEDTGGGSSDTGGGTDDTGSSSSDTGSTDDTGSSTGDTGATDSAPTGTPVTVTATTPTTTIPTVAKCSGDTYGSKGDLTAINTPVFVGSDLVSSLILRYDMGYYFGEPTRRAVISWEGKGSLSSIQWLAEVQDPASGKQYVSSTGKRVWASYNVGSIKDPGAGFGTDSTGSPNWSETFVTYEDATGVVFNSVSDVDAKSIYKACFKLASVRLLKLNGKPALKP
jgi:hypothetical protein